ncbi:MAG: ABC transporter substrate-binding protein, partial [Dehalococcoidia bacterium]|nr:ABC transporter substrate-binding protein [Dehalococcoidia bacterium]
MVVSLLLLASCVPASAPPTIKVGLVAPFSGRDAAAGYNMLYAAKLALKEWNDRGGVGGYGIELVAQDDRNEAEMGAVQARKMALDSQVMGVVGHPSRESALAATPVYREAGLPVLVTGAAVPEQDGGPPVFQLGPTESELAQETVRFAVAQGARRLAILDEAPPLTSAQQIYPVQGLAQLVERAALGNGPVVVLSGAPTPGRDNEARIIEDLKVNRPDLV